VSLSPHPDGALANRRPSAPPPAAGPASQIDLAAALGVAPAALEAAPVELDGEEAAAAALVRLHFQANRPEPAAFPRVAMRILDLVLDPEVDVPGLCRTVELDAAVSAGVLARANSASARALDRIETIPHAVTRLGLSEVARVASATALRTLYDGHVNSGFSTFVPLWPQLFAHSVVTARLASDLARGRPEVDADVAYMAGLLHDVGLAVAMRSLTALTLDGTLPLRGPESALRIIHQVHVEIGAETQRAWKLPARLREVAQRHHEATLPAGAPAPLIHVVGLASAIDLFRTAPAARPRAAAEVLEAARALRVTPAWLAAAVVHHGEAVAWARRSFAAA
jgi:putative nucleotidyltransferase with HDIG domain